MLFERIDREIAPMRRAYQDLMSNPGHIEDVLLAGAAKARQIATPFMAQLRQAVGLRSLRSTPVASSSTNTAKASAPSIKQYRDTEGKFYIKLLGADGALLVQSVAFDSPREAGAVAARLRQGDAAALQDHAHQLRLAPEKEAVLQALAALMASSESANL